MSIRDEHNIVESLRVRAELLETAPYGVVSRFVLERPIVQSLHGGDIYPAVFVAWAGHLVGMRSKPLRMQVGQQLLSSGSAASIVA